jgi:carbamoyl-phosphate synthase large subunit
VSRDGNAETAVVAVTGLHRGESPQPGAAVVSAVRRRLPDARIIGFCYDPMESGIYSQGGDWLDAIYLLPYPKAGSHALLERIDEVLAREAIDAIIPCLDTEIPNFIALTDELRDRGIHLDLPTLRCFEDRDKTNIADFCASVDVAAPRTDQANDAASLAEDASRIGYPCYVKGQLYGAYKVHSEAELYAAFSEVHDVWGGPVLVQEAIAGEEYDVVGLGDGEGGIVARCTIRKMLKSKLGKGFAGVVVADPAVEEAADRIIGGLKWRGPFELEFLKAAGRPHALFEMNPRFPSWVDFPAQIGCNLPGRMVEEMLGLAHAPVEACPPGRVFIRHCTELVADIRDIAALGTHGARESAKVAS